MSVRAGLRMAGEIACVYGWQRDLAAKCYYFLNASEMLHITWGQKRLFRYLFFPFLLRLVHYSHNPLGEETKKQLCWVLWSMQPHSMRTILNQFSQILLCRSLFICWYHFVCLKLTSLWPLFTEIIYRNSLTGGWWRQRQGERGCGKGSQESNLQQLQEECGFCTSGLRSSPLIWLIFCIKSLDFVKHLSNVTQTPSTKPVKGHTEEKAMWYFFAGLSYHLLALTNVVLQKCH